MKIITVPNEILEKKAKKVSLDKKTIQFAQQLTQKLQKESGLGLAAPQVGKDWRIFTTTLPNQAVKTYFNPKIISHADEKKLFKIAELDHQQEEDQPFLEGCLSIPGVWGTVKRWPEIKVSWQNEQNQEKTAQLTNLAAIVFQHELDHLEGVLFTQRVIAQNGQAWEEKNGQLEKISLQ